ncbi:ammosamide/lymphostin RiPP family protein [Rhodococcus sp. 06-235-1A]|uniref:ammosamide/lymphostin RiPP family protein n=1 Tax=Rhodococcus sp. 06-235-1A TaxID=2022508 RepID=UPI00117AC02F|nr:ammosamide/lymphostin RiPP family protein [Rhodococcus sp. 06-235-1A]
MGSEVQKKVTAVDHDEDGQAVGSLADHEGVDAKVVVDDTLEDLDDLDDVDFDLDEVENKIAPLALAEAESVVHP